MRIPNDRLLAEQCPEIDIILGGHDHHYVNEYVSRMGGFTIVMRLGLKICEG